MYSYIKKFRDSENVKFEKPSGSPAKLGTTKIKNRIKKMYENHPSTTTTAAATKFNISKSYPTKIKVHSLSIRAKTKKPAPNYKPTKEVRIKECCKKLLKNIRGKVVIIDDETYVPVDPSDVAGRQYYHSSNSSDVKYEDKIRKKINSLKKFCIWQCISSTGHVSDPLIIEEIGRASCRERV